MPVIPIDVGAVEETKPVVRGMYDLQIDASEFKTSNNGKPQIKVSLAIAGHDTAPNVSHYISLPADGDEPDKSKFKVLLLKRFLALFGQPIPNVIDTDKMCMAMIGAKAKAELELSEPDANGNVYNRLTVPRLRDEAAVGGGVPKPPATAKR